MIIQNHGNGAATEIAIERRLTVLETEMSHVDRRLIEISGSQQGAREREQKRDRHISSMSEALRRLASDSDQMKSDLKRFLVAAVLTIGGLLWQVIRAKLGF